MKNVQILGLSVVFFFALYGTVFGLSIAAVMNDGQGDFDPWNTTRWANWYDANGNLVYRFDIDCSIDFATRSTPWVIDLSNMEGGSTQRLFNITTEATSVEIDGNGLVIDARIDTNANDITDYDFNWTTNTSTKIGAWRAFMFDQKTSATSPTTVHNLTLMGFRVCFEFSWAHRREVTIYDNTTAYNLYAVFARGENVTVQYNSFTKSYLAAVYCEKATANWTFYDNEFQDNAVKGTLTYADILLDACHDHEITYNEFLASTYSPVEPYHTAISIFRNRGENYDIRRYSSRDHFISDNTFAGYHIAIDICNREGGVSNNDKESESRCYTNDITVMDNELSNCDIGILCRGSYNYFENNSFYNCSYPMAFYCPFYKNVENVIADQYTTNVSLWAVESDIPSSVLPYLSYTGSALNRAYYVPKSEKLFHIRSDGSATISSPSPATRIIADSLLIPDTGTNDLQDFYDNGGRPIDVAVGNFSQVVPGDEIAVIWDDPVSQYSVDHYYTIIIYDCRGVELDRCGRSADRWDKIVAGDFLPEAEYDWWHVLEDEIAAVSSLPDENGHYPIYIFQRGIKEPVLTLAENNDYPVISMVSGNFYVDQVTLGDYGYIDFEEISYIVEQPSPDYIKTIKPADPNYSDNSYIGGIPYIDMASGNFDANDTNGEEIAGIRSPDASTMLVAAWDFESADGGPLADKAPSGNVADNLSVVGNLSVSNGKATFSVGNAGALKALDSDDLDLTGDFTIWVRAKVMTDPTYYLFLVDKRRFSPQARSYGFFVNCPNNVEGGPVANNYGLGGQICQDGVSGQNEIWDVNGAEVVPTGVTRELVMRCRDKGALQVEWFVSTVSSPYSVFHWQRVNGMTCQENVRSIFSGAGDLYIGNNVNISYPSATVEYEEVRVYKGALSMRELALIVPADPDRVSDSSFPVYVHRIGSSAYTTFENNQTVSWRCIAGGDFLPGNSYDEIALISSNTINSYYNVDYYLLGSNYKTSTYSVMTETPLCVDVGDFSLETSLDRYDSYSGDSTSDYGSEISSWGDHLTVLPANGHTSSSIPVYLLSSDSNPNKQHKRMIPFLR